MKVLIGDILKSKQPFIVNTVNCVGVMGKGIALDFKNKYPDMFADYVNRCNDGLVKPGEPYIYKDKEVSIINFPTKNHWRSNSSLSYIRSGLTWIKDNYDSLGITGIAIPPLGCGNGGLIWSTVGPIIYNALKDLPIDIELYAPYGTPKYELSEDYLNKQYVDNQTYGNSSKKINKKWLLILRTIKELNEGKYSLNVGRTIYQKICYVLTRNGVDLGFNFSRSNYGPYSLEAQETIGIFANANLLNEENMGKMIAVNVSDKFNINENDYSKEDWQATNQTIELFSRVKNTEQAEMIATVLYSYDQLNSTNKIKDYEVYDYVLNWKPHWNNKKYELCETIYNMAVLDLIDIEYTGNLIDIDKFI